jgi:hypothetical protein
MRDAAVGMMRAWLSQSQLRRLAPAVKDGKCHMAEALACLTRSRAKSAAAAFRIDSSRPLKHPSNFAPIVTVLGRGAE